MNAFWDIRKAKVCAGSLGTDVVILRLGLIERAPSVSCPVREYVVLRPGLFRCSGGPGTLGRSGLMVLNVTLSSNGAMDS